MATFTSKKKGSPKRWKGQVWFQGRMAAVKWFGSNKADERSAIAWEVTTRKELEEAAATAPEEVTPLASKPQRVTVLEWGTAYLEECQRRNTLATFKEKRDGFRRFIRYLEQMKGLSPDDPVESFDRKKARKYLAWQHDQRGPNCSNKDRKILTTAWKWGAAYLDHFPLDMPDSFLACQQYAEIRVPWYIPPEEDFWKVYEAAPEREKAMLTCFLNLAARKGELLKLTWQDVDFERGTVVLTTRKTRTGTAKRDEMPMNEDVRTTMLWLWQYRQGKGNHVFTCPVEPYIGQPYKTAAHVMKRLCTKAKVKPFGFHAIRHLAATILAQEGKSLFAIQHALRHEKQTTTDRYLHSLGAFSEVSDALSALASRGPANRHILFPAPSSPLSKKESFAGKKEEKQGGEAKAVVVRRNGGRTSDKHIPTGTE